MTLETGNFIVNSEEETILLARKIASQIKPLDVLAFEGDLGSGKTFLCRHIIKTLCGDVNVSSPTFNLLQIYGATNFEIYHFDLYRLKSIHEAYELGIEDAFNHHVCLIEWPEIIRDLLPKSTITINIEMINDASRKILINYS